MTDAAIAAIREQKRARLSFAWFRRTFMEDHDLKGALESGHAILDTVPLLGQYLYTHGRMIESQWQNASAELATVAPPRRLIDYGCGQGLAGLLVNDVTGGRLLADIDEIVLIEPSAIALARAEAIYEKLCPSARVTAICKLFDEVDAADIPQGSSPTLHLFSNSLDVIGFDPEKLLDNALAPGSNTLISVSHDRPFNGGTPRIEAVKLAVEGGKLPKPMSTIRSSLRKFTCSNPGRSAGVVWLAEIDVNDG